ncbi:3-oxoacyl-ACP synthase III family protein [Streptomyces acidiscabies]|uniref:3-oxoacyl-ACP synthase n=1 Tax=Streptomyces acidiscabies TaxID=42234 RepID=A0A0L0JMI2_9ACTN|nr:ketoacyl-ACP synthase III [Streptomyces acidiscabies]KND26600.1 3-oxoacyl-ACP synthase [Streptomyces acidiscabies]
MPTGIVGLGAFTPAHVIDNAQITTWTGATDAWITERTGIQHRRYAAPGVTTSELAAQAVQNLFADSPRTLDEVGLTILATSTPDQPQPSTAVRLHNLLRVRTTAPAFDLNAVCAGFVYALSIADAMLSRDAGSGTALVVGVDIYSTIMDRSDRRTVALFGDGAGAVLLGEVPDGYGIHATSLIADGDSEELVEVVAGGTRERADDASRAAGRHLFRMRGRPVRDYALHSIPKAIDDVLGASGYTADDIDRFIVHQGNSRLVEAVAAQLGVDMARVPLSAPHFGNTGAAALPLTLCHSHRQRPLERGERIVFAAVGGGMTAGAVLLTWY